MTLPDTFTQLFSQSLTALVPSSPQCSPLFGTPTPPSSGHLGFRTLGGSEGRTKLGKAVAQAENNDCSKHAPG